MKRPSMKAVAIGLGSMLITMTGFLSVAEMRAQFKKDPTLGADLKAYWAKGRPAVRKQPWEVVPDKYKPTFENCVKGAKYQLEAAGVQKGDKVLILESLSDTGQVDLMWFDAFFEAARQIGAHMSVHFISKTNWRPGADAILGHGLEPWIPYYVDKALEEADFISVSRDIEIESPSYMRGVAMFGQGVGKRNIVKLWLPTNSVQLGYLPYSTFPVELDRALNRKVYEFLDIYGKPKKIRITDPLGTDFTFTYNIDLDYIKQYYPHLWNKGIPGGAFQWWQPYWSHDSIWMNASKQMDTEGVLVINAWSGGTIPTMKLFLKDGKVARIQGGGALTELYLREIRQYDQVKYNMPGKLAQGADSFISVAIGHLPKAVDGAFFADDWYEKLGWRGYHVDRFKVAGVLHFSVGDPYRGYVYDLLPDGTPPMKLNAGHLYYPTVTVDGRKLIDNGHLIVLDDPEVRKIAAKYGDPDQLLHVDWRDKNTLDDYVKGFPHMKRLH